MSGKESCAYSVIFALHLRRKKSKCSSIYFCFFSFKVLIRRTTGGSVITFFVPTTGDSDVAVDGMTTQASSLFITAESQTDVTTAVL